MEIKLPINFTQHSNKLRNKAKMLTSFLVGDKFIDIRWEYEVEKKAVGEIVGRSRH